MIYFTPCINPQPASFHRLKLSGWYLYVDTRCDKDLNNFFYLFPFNYNFWLWKRTVQQKPAIGVVYVTGIMELKGCLDTRVETVESESLKLGSFIKGHLCQNSTSFNFCSCSLKWECCGTKFLHQVIDLPFSLLIHQLMPCYVFGFDPAG